MATREDPRIARTRLAVFTAALELAAERGFASTTMEAISQASGVSKATIYRYWPDTSSLFLAALEYNVEEYPALDSGNLRDDCIHVMLQLTHGLQRSYGRLFPHLISSGATDEAFAAVQHSYAATRESINREIFGRAIERGELSADLDLDLAGELLYAPVFYRALVAHQPINDQWAVSHIDSVLALL